MNALVAPPAELFWVAVKAALLYVTAVIGFRVSRRRTVGAVSPYDFVAAVAVGAIVGRLPTVPDASYLAGAVTLAAVLLTHVLITRLRFFRLGRRLVDHSPRVLVAHGAVLQAQLRRSGLTRADLDTLLREHGVTDRPRSSSPCWSRRAGCRSCPGRGGPARTRPFPGLPVRGPGSCRRIGTCR